MIDCVICAETKTAVEMFHSRSCGQLFCRDCIGQHIAAKIRENISMVRCPDVACGAVLEPQNCRGVIPPDVFDSWERALCESTLLGWDRVHCPYAGCPAVFFIGSPEDQAVMMSECMTCNWLFCASSHVPWHAGVTCEEYQALDPGEREREDLMLMEVGRRENWKRCPKCNYYIERNQGCLHMTCRCSFQFCYGCGKEWSDEHASCHT